MENIYVNTDSFKPRPEAQQTGPSSSRRTVWGSVLCLGLLSVLLLAGLIGLGVTYHRSSADLRASGEERDRLNASLSAMTVTLDRLQDLSARKRICPAGWRTFSCSCYLLSNKLGSWDKAREDCRGREADLVVIESRGEQEFLWTLAKEDTWIGLRDRNSRGSWKWIDGTLPVVWFWKRNQPDKGDGHPHLGEEDCVHFEGGNRPHENWNDRRCDESMHWICEQLA